ncbi:alpha/beta fold hydrolase [Streptomyces sp. NPDC086549]|uniref:alpha/beta fold hydrolase n=1 Tax=Streptomyces sp. NPDC086549 TaxID=3365752 RepID=UPI0038211876
MSEWSCCCTARARAAGSDCRGLAFDFSGHGESTVALRELGLRRRFEQAVSVIDARAPAGEPLVLVGFSMSGQTATDPAAVDGGGAGVAGRVHPVHPPGTPRGHTPVGPVVPESPRRLPGVRGHAARGPRRGRPATRSPTRRSSPGPGASWAGPT